MSDPLFFSNPRRGETRSHGHSIPLNTAKNLDPLEELRIEDVSTRLDEFRDLKEGWLDGKGVAPGNAGLDWFAKCFARHYPDVLPVPFVYPTAEGGVQLEWTLAGHELSLDVNLTNHRAEWHDLNLKTRHDQFREINLDDSGDWTNLVSEVQHLVGVQM